MKKNPKLKIYFDPILPNIDPTLLSGISGEEFRAQYRYAMEELPKYMQKPIGKLFTINVFIDAPHA